ncbi:MAG: membrane protein insertion efficiency factor YidD [Planctomycetes bacterium]|nr:membrane protein insertion efficiency factor YidD [Planctomycetota bacterium]
MIYGLWSLVSWLLSTLLILPVRFYQIAIGPMLPKVCRFEPSCSVYFIAAVEKHGPCKGCMMGIWRLCRCGPWCNGGYDPP